MKTLRLVPSILILVLATGVANADVKIKSRMTVMGFNMDSTTYIKGSTQRNDTNSPYGGGNSYSLYQCDQMRVVQVNTTAKAYYVMSLDEEKSASENNAATGQAKSGGVVQMTAKMTETGEKKKILGFDARHVVIEISTEPGPGACTPKSSMKQDVWFIDLPVFAGCANSPREYAKMRPQQNECGDKVNFKLVGAVKPGYPAEMTMTMPGENGQPIMMKRETVDISTATLDASLFEVPAGYRQVNSPRDLVMAGGMGRGGYGVAPTGGSGTVPSVAPAGGYPPGYRPTTAEEAKAYGEYLKQQYSGQIADAQNRTGQAQQTTDIANAALAANQNANAVAQANRSLTIPTSGRTRIGLVVNANGGDADTGIQRLIMRFNSMGVDAVSLQSFEGTTLEEQDTASKGAGCDYLLVTDATVKASGSVKKKLGGLLNKATGGDAGSDTPAFDASVSYRLYRVGDATARLDSSAQVSDANSVEDGMRKSVDREVPLVIAQVNKDKVVKK